MNLKSRLILDDYRLQREYFIKLGDVVSSMLSEISKELNLNLKRKEFC